MRPIKHYTKKEMFLINLSWNIMAFGRKLMRMGLERIGSFIVDYGVKMKID